MDRDKLGRDNFLGWLTPLTVVVMTMAWSSAHVGHRRTLLPSILKTMLDFMAKQKNISMTFDAAIEVITQDLQKIQFANSGTVLVNRPDKLRATRTGGYSHVELVFDGKTAAFLSKDVEFVGLQA